MKYLYGWDDAGWTEEADKVSKQLEFGSVQEAQAELDNLFAEVRKAVASGNMDHEEKRDDYRIVEVDD